MTDETKKIDAAVKAIIANALRNAAEHLMRDEVTEAVAAAASAPTRSSASGYPGRGQADAYFCGCTALSELSKKCGLVLFKFGCTQQGVLTRQEDLCRDGGYGGRCKVGGVAKLQPGWDTWEMRQIHPVVLPIGSAVRFVSRALRVTLEVPFPVFEEAVRQAMKPFALHEYIRSAEGRAHFASMGVDVAEARRFTVAMFGDQARAPDLATEIYRIKPRKDMAKIIAILDRAAR